MRKVMAPAFSYRTIKELYPVFWSKASEAVLLIKDEVRRGYNASTPSIVDMEDWAARVALDIIGEAGFGSKFNSLTNPHAHVPEAYRAAFLVDETTRPIFVLSMLTTPTLTNLLPLKKVKDKLLGMKTISDWLRDFIEERKKEMYMNVDDVDYFKKSGHKDIITNVIHSRSMGVSELVDQSNSILAAGHGNYSTFLETA